MTSTPLDDPARHAADVLRRGGLVALPTETVYGLAGDARNADAVARIFAAKGRPVDHPLIVHLGDKAQLSDWARDIPDAAWRLAEAFWPGPLTLVLRRAPDVLDAVTGGMPTVALRVPGHPLALSVLELFGGGVAAPSANRYGSVSPTIASDVLEELGDRVDLILDGGPCDVGIESTIVDLSGDAVCLLRPGLITAEDLQRVVAVPMATAPRAGVRSPGLKDSHYSPRARVVLASMDDAAREVERWQASGHKVGLLSARRPPALAQTVPWLNLSEDVFEQARVLYHHLREADHLGLEVLVAVLPVEDGPGRALCDRLRRAAGLGQGGS
jgi:L-threonylcarbamoyladenylate synthase